MGDLAFKVVPDQYSTKQLRLHNRSEQTMAFKIKTTSPKQYFVRPNQGLIKAGDRQIIHVMMGKVSEVPKTPCKDRFLVQSSPYDGEPTDKFEWKSHFDKDHKCHERKLSCKYITDDVRRDAKGVMVALEGLENILRVGQEEAQKNGSTVSEYSQMIDSEGGLDKI